MIRRLSFALTVFVFSLVASQAHSQCVSLTSTGSAYTQNFDSLVNTAGSTTNTLLPNGWFLTETGGGARDNEQYGVDTGSGATGDTFSFGSTGSTDRAFGGLQSGTLIPVIGACFTNNTGATLSSLDIAYVGEQWRLGTAARTDQLTFEYSTSATSLATGTWTAIAALNFLTPNTVTTGAKDGNLAANRTALSSTISALSILNGTTFWIRWNDVNASGADDGLAVDDFSLTPQGAGGLPTLSINDVSLNEGNAGTTSFTFTVSLSAPAPLGGVTFDIATADGTASAASSDYVAKSLTAETIPAGSSTYSFTVLVDGDTLPETDETFFVNVTNVVNANATDGQGLGTIVNDDAAPNLTINDASLNEGDSGTTTFTFTVSLSAPAPAGGVTFDIATADGTAIAAGGDYVANSLAGQTIPAGSSTYTFSVLVNGDTVGEQTETFFVNVTNVVNAIPTDGQGLGTIVNDDAIRINAVQGTGTASPLVGQTVTVEGIVTSLNQGAGSLNGIFIQEPDAKADADPATSEGIFVFTNASPAAVAVGDLVRVTGTVTEFGTAPNTLTEIVTPTVSVLSSGNPLPALTAVTLPVASLAELERFEGMRVQFTQTLTVSDHFDLAHFGEITLTANGRAIQPTNVIDPNDNPAGGTTSTGTSNVAAITAANDLIARSKIILDDASTVSFPATIPYLNPADNTIRLGTTVANLTGIFSQSFGSYRVFATTPPAFAYAPRPLAPPAVGGNVKVGAANVLNYFNGNGAGGGFPTSRGADSLIEFNRQRDKIIAALIGLNADVVGLLEIENDGIAATSSIQDLINGLNASSGAGTWAFVADPTNFATSPGGTDLIRPAFIYKTAVVAPHGASIASTDTAFSNARSPVAQTFRVLANNELFTAVVNHFKSKGSGGTGADADQNDGQGFFNNARKLQAGALLTFMNSLLPTTPRIIALGDFNAYAEEDPVDILRAGGFSTLTSGNSYMFGGLSGSLDHAVGNAALAATVTGADKWHINADEPIFLDYNVENKNTAGCVSACTNPDLYAATPFRASDHDPVLVGLQLSAAQTITFPAVAAQTYAAGGTFNVTATATSNLTVTFTSTTPSVCTVSGTVVTIVSADTCTIAADQAGDTNFNAAPQVTQNITINQASQSITFPAVATQTYAAGGTFAVAATASSTLPVAYASNTPTICTVSGSTVTIVNAGACVIAADQAGNTNFTAAMQATQNITINQATQTITFPVVATQTYAPAGTFTVAATSSAGLTVSFASNTTGVCTVSGTTVTIVSAGSCSITADQAGNTNVSAATPVTQSITINLGTQTIAFPAITAQTFAPSATFAITATASSGLTVTFASTTTAICTISGATVTIVSAGSCGITASQAGNANYAAGTPVSQNIIINPAAQTITFPAVATQTFAASGTFTVAATSSSGLAVTFASTTTAICTVSGATVTIVSAGSCGITASQAGNANYSAATPVSQNITINPAAQTITFPAVPARTFAPAGTFALAATASSGLTVTFASTTPTVCTVSGSTATMVAGGVCSVTASQAGSTNFAAATPVIQNITINPATQTITFPAVAAQTFAPSGTFVVSATSSSGLTVTFTSTTPTVCAVSGTTVTMLSGGTCTVTASQAGNGSYAAATPVPQNIMINATAQTITFPAIAAQIFSPTGTVALAATASSGLMVTFASTTPAVCTVSGSTVTMLTGGTCTVSAAQTGNASYLSAAPVTQNITINPGAQTITFGTLANRSISVTPFVVSATASSGLAITFTSTTPAICTATGTNGSTVTLLALGTCTLRAAQAGNASYLAATAVTQSFAVQQATNGVLFTSFPNPAPFGEPVTLTAQVQGSNPTGTVTFSVNVNGVQTVICGPVTLAGGIATCVVPGNFLRTNPVAFIASYSGDTNNAPSTALLQQLVNLDANTLTAIAHPAQTVAGRSVKLSALVVAKSVTSNITFYENGVPLVGCSNLPVTALPGNTESGTATCMVNAITAGEHTYVVTHPALSGVGFEQVNVRVNVAATGPLDYTDMWWAGQVENGWGISITQHGNIQFAVIYAYDAAGKPTWYAMSGGNWNAGLTAFTGALFAPTSSPFNAYDSARFKANTPVGSATITYTGPATATLTYTINGVSGTKNIVREPFATDDALPRLQVNDLWWGGIEQNGWGMNIAQQGRTLFPVWYTYDASGNTTWFGVPGGTWSGTTFTGDIYSTTSSPWLGTNYDATKFAGSKVGTLTLQFTDQTSAFMTYTVNGVTQTKTIVRQPF